MPFLEVVSLVLERKPHVRTFFSTFLAVVSVVFSHSNAIAQNGSPLGGFVLEASYSPESGVTAELSYATDSSNRSRAGAKNYAAAA